MVPVLLYVLHYTMTQQCLPVKIRMQELVGDGCKRHSQPCLFQVGAETLAKIVASAVAYDAHIARNVYFQHGYGRSSKLYAGARESIGRVSTMIIDTFNKVVGAFSCLQTITYAVKAGTDALGSRLTYMSGPRDDAEVAQTLQCFVQHTVYNINLLAGYDDDRAKVNNALAVWGVFGLTSGQTYISDVALQRMLPCLPLRMNNSPDRCVL
jgi:hypothetical protein